MSVINNNLLLSSDGYNISRSVRLRSSASAYFSRTPASASNRTTWTLSTWVKRGSLGGTGILIDVGGTTNLSDYQMLWFSSDTIDFHQQTTTGYTARLVTTAVYRDPSAWYHIVAVWNTTSGTTTLTGTPTDRMQLWVNGVQLTSFSTTVVPASSLNSRINLNALTTIGQASSGTAFSFDGYLTEINFIDGQPLTPLSFGSTNAITGVWQPIKYTGTYGTNGFYLNFSDNSAATAATIGKDYSGNANNWTPNNISVTAGTTYDSMLDVPTPYADGGNGRGNYAVLNPLDRNTNLAPSDGNLTYAVSGAVQYSTRSTIFPNSGKWYAEFTISSSSAIIGIANQSAVVQGANGLNGVFAFTTLIYNNSGTAAQSGLASFAASDVISVAYDADTNSVQFYKNNSTFGTAVTPSATVPFCFYVGANGATCTVNANFGQRPFTYTPPSGYVALNTQNLPTPTISNGANYMAATIYTGTGATASISNAVNGVSFQPDFVWVKNRTNAYDHDTYDSLRPQGSRLITNLTNAEGGTTTTQVNSFNSNGFGLGTYIGVNESGSAFVGWQWKAGTTSSSNTNGSITSTVSVGATQGFSVATFTAPASGAFTFGHGLGVTPSMFILKDRTNAGTAWGVWHKSLSNLAQSYLQLNSTNAVASNATIWNNTAPTSTVISTQSGQVVLGSANSVAYCFSEVAGYSKFGSYTGNGSADGPFVYCGFRPRFIMIKRTDVADNWNISDSSRNTYNVNNASLFADLSNAESTSVNISDFLSNGFKIRGTPTWSNANGGTYIFMAVAENPFKLSLAR